MTIAPSTTRRRTPATRRQGGGISRLLVSGLGWLGSATRTMGESLRLLWFAASEIVVLIGTLVGILLSAMGIKGLDSAFKGLRFDADQQRRWASRTGRAQLHAEYRPLTDVEPGGLEELRSHLADPARARDLDWHVLNPVVSVLGTMASWTPVFTAVSTFSIFWSATTGGYAYVLGYYFGHYDPPRQMLLFGLAFVQILASPFVAGVVQRIHRRWVRFMLAGEVTEDLEERVRTLTATRMTALDMQEAEIQRIERDLHDGAQARLVTIGMTVTQASRLMKHDPDAALELLGDVKNDSTTALQELRTLVRGIRPPVLADRGLPDALRALAASHPIDTTVSSSLEERLIGSVESALYFAVSELMANASKHSSASRIGVGLSEADGHVLVEVFDDGLGGAEGQDLLGGGIDGIRRRLAPFDGTLELVSPVGGGTFATIRVPRPTS